ncbi:MAG: radical SAM protein [Deltaproteobacteria bacterium]|nr:radical SAM protein [Deltaproteobacteria bacterium]
MAKKKRLIIPVFIPFGGCPHQCVFCDQSGITGKAVMPGLEDVRSTIEAYLSTWKGEGPREAAFYGGSFTGLPMEKQEEYLECAHAYVRDGRIDSIRLSTRPDYIGGGIVAFLKGYGVGTVELGVQSMSDAVLRLSGRGHTAEHSRNAVNILKEAGIKAGVQIMPGLPGDTADTIISTVKDVIGLSPDFVRIYPTLVLRDTPLYAMYLRGDYRPWALDEMVEVCREIAGLLKAAGVGVIRMGLQPTKELAGSIVSGPFHPSFRQLVEGS